MVIDEFLAEISGLARAEVRYFAAKADGDHTLARVYVGCGRWPKAREVQRERPAFLLTNKGSASRFGFAVDRTSVTHFVAKPPQGYLESFELWPHRPLGPVAVLDAIAIVGDDASPDSVFAMILFLARLAEVDLSEFPAAWAEAVDRWERTGLSRDPEKSWCVLESSLVHRSFPLQEELSSGHLSKGWLDALRFAAYCLQLRLDPDRIPELPDCSEYVEARAALEQERETYRFWLERASSVQVSLPLRGTSDRQIVVDGLFIEARQITGTTKVFFRSDREHSPLKKGFPFAVIYSPSKVGGEIEITISIDPSCGLELRKLWEALEEAENEAWKAHGKQRPSDAPRRMEGASSPYNEPWYLTPDATLIGRPYRLADGSPGSLLTWEEVREVIWLTLNPLRSVQVTMFSTGAVVPILELEPEAKQWTAQ